LQKSYRQQCNAKDKSKGTGCPHNSSIHHAPGMKDIISI